ncbi:unnamed protein product [Knipowitschia caucasica]|uniref:Hexosyltransferase n=1 Tax=Knipowitschia caucasica TaxID=637954 RepID=A0AAV2M112_KNICA
MTPWVRRRRLLWGALKPVVSLTLICASVLMLHRLRLTVEKDAPSTTAALRNFVALPNTTALRDPADLRDTRVVTCTENASVHAHAWFRRLDARFHQFVLRRHCRFFPLRINHPEKCARGPVHVLIVVKSVIEQHERREAVRQTWGREHETDSGSVRTVFLLGTASTGKDARNLQQLLLYEDRVHGDILQWDFMDTFYNLTLKELNFLQWFHTYCPSAHFIFKGDDDVYVNTRNLLQLVRYRTEERRHERLFVGDVISRAAPIRNRQSKYFIPKELHAGPYPPYAGGGGFLMSGPLAHLLLRASDAVPLFPIDDVFLGMCLQRLGTAPEAHAAFRTFGVTRRRFSPMNREPCFYTQLIVVHKLSAQELLRMWNVTHNPGLVCARSSVMTE